MPAISDGVTGPPVLRVVESDAIEPAVSFSASISAPEMVRLTGIGRERLRTWERRHGFPKALRTPNNSRRYHVDDVRRVAAVHQLVNEGFPIADAIKTVMAQAEAPQPQGMGSLGDALDHAPMPALAISEPHALRVVWTNGRTRTSANAPQVGATLAGPEPLLPPAALDAIRNLLASEETGQCVIEHLDWMNPAVTVRSIAWRLTGAASPDPAVVVMQMPETRELGAPGRIGQFHDQSVRWASASADARHVLQTSSGLAGIQQALRTLVTASGARDGLLALSRADHLRTATSVSGGIAAREAEMAACDDLCATLRDGELDWLSETTKGVLGVPAYAGAVAIPLVVGQMRLGFAVLVFDAEFAVGDATRELMLALGGTFAAALVRENTGRATTTTTGAPHPGRRLVA